MTTDPSVFSREVTPAETELIPEVTWCPECGGPPKDEHAALAYCHTHMPVTQGTADRLLEPTQHIFHSEAGGPDNVLACAFFHRNKEVSNT